MNTSHFISPFAAVIVLLAGLILGSAPAQASDTPVQERLVSIDKKAQTFSQVLEAVAEQAGIKINARGSIPTASRDISLNEVPLSQAMGHILRVYGVRNHAAAFNPESGLMVLAILETSSQLATLSKEKDPQLEGNMQPLTFEQIEQLQPEDPIDRLPLTQEQIAVLEPEEEHEPLAQDQIDQLEPEQVHEPLTNEQIDQLIPEEEHEPLTQEQIDQLVPEKLPE